MFIKSQLYFSLIVFTIFFSFSEIGYSIDFVPFEFLWFDCEPCYPEYYPIYLHNNRIVLDLERDYGIEVNVRRIEFYSKEGMEKVEQYNLSLMDWNAIVVNYEVAFVGFCNETEIRELIDTFLLVWDVNGDKIVGMDDAEAVAEHFGQDTPHPDWDSKYDITRDNYVGIDDIVAVAGHFGESS